MSTTTYTVQGMTCTSCAGKVTGAVADIEGVEGTEVDLAAGELSVTGSAYEDRAVREAITDAGYRVG